jgi:hypothetical protein
MVNHMMKLMLTLAMLAAPFQALAQIPCYNSEPKIYYGIRGIRPVAHFSILNNWETLRIVNRPDDVFRSNLSFDYMEISKNWIVLKANDQVATIDCLQYKDSCVMQIQRAFNFLKESERKVDWDHRYDTVDWDPTKRMTNSLFSCTIQRLIGFIN